MTDLPAETVSPEPVPPPLPKPPPVVQTNTTVGRSIAWAVLFLAVFYGVALVYGVGLGIYYGVTESGFAAEDPELFMQSIEERMDEMVFSPTALFVMGMDFFLWW